MARNYQKETLNDYTKRKYINTCSLIEMKRTSGYCYSMHRGFVPRQRMQRCKGLFVPKWNVLFEDSVQT